MRAVIIAGGVIKDYDYISKCINKNDTIICADSGYDHALCMGLTPDMLVGDFDSIAAKPTDVEILRYPEEKDFTDTEIAVGLARTRGFKKFLLLGVTGGRHDHMLANIMLLSGMIRNGESAEIIDECSRIIYTESEVTICEPPGTLLSVIPLTVCHGVSNYGLKYPLEDATLTPDSTRGISNVLELPCAGVSVRQGGMFVIIIRRT